MQPTQNTKKRVSIRVIAVLLGMIILILVGGLYAWRSQPSKSDNKSNTQVTPEIISSVPQKTEKTLKITLNVLASTKTPFTLQGVSQYNSQPDTAVNEQMQYKFHLIESNKEVYTTSFRVPVTIGESVDLKTKKIIRLETPSIKTISFNTPFVKDGSVIKVVNKAGVTVFSDTVKNVQVNDNSAQYQTVKGGDVPIKQ